MAERVDDNFETTVPVKTTYVLANYNEVSFLSLFISGAAIERITDLRDETKRVSS